MSTVTLTDIHGDVWLCLLPFCSYTDAIRLSHIHPYLFSLSQQRAWADCLRRSHIHPHLSASQHCAILAQGWSSRQLVDLLVPALARVETHLLHTHLIPPLHLSHLLQALLTADLSSALSASSSSSLGGSSLSTHHSLAHNGVYPSMQSFFLNWHRHPSEGPLSSPTSLHSLGLPSVCLWLCNPFSIPSWVHRFSMRKRTAEAQDELKDVVAQIDGRVVWIGSAQLRTQPADDNAQQAAAAEASPFALGYWMGRVEPAAHDKHGAVCVSSSSIDECQQRMHDPALDWATLPVVVFRVYASTLDHVCQASYQSMRLFPCLADVLRLALPARGAAALSTDVLAQVDEVLGAASGSEAGQCQTLLLQQRRLGNEGQLEWQRNTVMPSVVEMFHSSRPKQRWVA